MSRISFENYGKKAKTLYSYSYTEIAGRYPSQESAERNIFIEVISKLEVNAQDKLLDIGCGSGNLYIPLSFVCKQITGIDHEACLGKLRSRYTNLNNTILVPGNFLDMSIGNKFDKVLCYSVLQYLADAREVTLFVKKALNLLVPGGKALFGDIPNTSTKKRFLDSRSGSKFSEEWNSSTQKNKIGDAKIEIEEDNDVVKFDDELVLEILKQTRSIGYHSYVLAQSPHLPFGHTREDIIVDKPV